MFFILERKLNLNNQSRSIRDKLLLWITSDYSQQQLFFRNLEGFPIEYRKTKTKVTTLANGKQVQTTQRANKNSKQIHVTGAKRGKTLEAKTRLVFVWIPTG